MTHASAAAVRSPLGAFLPTLLGMLLAMIAAVASPAAGQGLATENQIPGFPGLPGSAADAPNVVVTAQLNRTQHVPGEQAVLVIDLAHAPTWHTYPPGVEAPPELQGLAPIPVSISVESGGVPIGVGPVQWPESKPYDINLTGTPVSIQVFGGTVRVFVPLVIGDAAEVGSAGTLTVAVGYQACDDSTCARPETETFELPVQIVSLEDRAAVPDNQAGNEGSDAADLLAGFDPSVFAGSATWSDQLSTATASSGADGERSLKFFGRELPDPRTPIGLLVIFLAAAAGGLILNMTPCVLPVIPIKVMTISKHAGTPGRSLVLGLWMAIGVVAFWAAIGVPVVAITSVTDPTRIFGFWWVNLGVGAVIAIMGVGIMGAFNLTLPDKVYAINPKADTAWGSFVFGIMTAVLGLPCFGFVAGGLLAGSATLPPLVIMAIFVGIGVGMASPYLVLSAKPGLVNKIPRTGPASELVKQVMGLLMIAAAAYFTGAGLISLVNERPWLGKQLHWWAVAIFTALAGGWLVVQTFKITTKPGPRVVFGALGLLLAVFAVATAQSFTSQAKAIYLDKTWVAWTPEAFAEARSQGHVVVLDFTADWCINCKLLKSTQLSGETVKSVLQQDNVVAMTVDLTSNTAPGWDKLEQLGRTGIPLLAIYDPESDEPWLSGAYTAGQVLAAIETAGG